jgi:chloramphenicol 3-O phosphotransferase
VNAGGKVILVVGPSSAGKSTLARAIQAAAPEPYLVLSLDGLFASVDERWGSGGAFREAGFAYADQADGSVRVVYGEIGRRMLAGMRRAAAAHARAGVNVVFDDMLLEESAAADWAEALAGVDALLVRLTAPLNLLREREAARPHPRKRGLAAGHTALHDAIAADIVIDTGATAPAAAATMVLEAQLAPERVLAR